MASLGHTATAGATRPHSVFTCLVLSMHLQEKLLGAARKPMIRESPIGIVNVDIL